ncbi:MAG: polysaccharide biosynthesis/export family protein, partial [Elusimicrobiota bacterium]
MSGSPSSSLLRRAKRIRLLLMDVDGVLTDGRLYHFVDQAGRLVEFKGFHGRDGVALIWLAENGIRTGIISGRVCPGVRGRAKMLKMSYIVEGTLDKAPALRSILKDSGVAPEETAFVGDDLPDIPALRAVGLGVAVSDACPEARRAARWVTRSPGGRGAIREVAQLILKAQGRWSSLLARYAACLLLLPLSGCVSFQIPRSEGADASATAGPAARPAPEAAGAPAETAAPSAKAPPAEVRSEKEEAAIQSALQFIQQKQGSYKISPADLLEVTIYQEKDLDRKVRVSPEGTITFPLIGQVEVGGVSVAQAEAAILAKLKRFLLDPQVTIFIAEYGNKQVFVLGEVKSPGSYPLPTEAPLSVLEAIT